MAFWGKVGERGEGWAFGRHGEAWSVGWMWVEGARIKMKETTDDSRKK